MTSILGRNTRRYPRMTPVDEYSRTGYVQSQPVSGYPLNHIVDIALPYQIIVRGTYFVTTFMIQISSYVSLITQVVRSTINLFSWMLCKEEFSKLSLPSVVLCGHDGVIKPTQDSNSFNRVT